MSTRVWSEHLVDIVRALGVMQRTSEQLNEVLPEGAAGHYSDLEFVLPDRVGIQIDGIPTGWALVWDEETWWADFGGDDDEG